MLGNFTQNTIVTIENQLPEHKIKALVVDDDRIMRIVMGDKLESMGCTVVFAKNGKEATNILCDGHDIDLILLDREMPEMNGIELLSWIRMSPKLNLIPRIMVTGATNVNDILEGIDAGAFYYLTKPINIDVLCSIVAAAIRDINQRRLLTNELKKHQTSFNLLHSCTFYLQTITEAESLSAFLANCYPEPDRVLLGLAELIINAVEHGNLAITYDEKTELLANGQRLSEIERRLKLPQYKDRKVMVSFRRNKGEIALRVEDMGDGFDWKKYIDIDPKRSTDNHGRGIAQAKSISFDKITYNTKGNKVTAIVYVE